PGQDGNRDDWSRKGDPAPPRVRAQGDHLFLLAHRRADARAQARGSVVIKKSAPEGRAQGLMTLERGRAGLAVGQMPLDLQARAELQLAVRVSLDKIVLLRAAHFTPPSHRDRSGTAADSVGRGPGAT